MCVVGWGAVESTGERISVLVDAAGLAGALHEARKLGGRAKPGCQSGNKGAEWVRGT